MTDTVNPFYRGYSAFVIHRMLCIAVADNRMPLIYRPLHASQSHLSDDDVRGRLCLDCDTHAWVIEGYDLPDEATLRSQRHGFVRMVVYEIIGQRDDTVMHIGSAYAFDAAQRTVAQLRFETGVYSRCWEINSRHLPAQAWRYLEHLAGTTRSSGLLFEAFSLPDSPALGCKLIATPWTDRHLRDVDAQTAQQLREEHLAAGVPAALVDVLHQAGEADTRILIFDFDAPVLGGLPLFD